MRKDGLRQLFGYRKSYHTKTSLISDRTSQGWVWKQGFCGNNIFAQIGFVLTSIAIDTAEAIAKDNKREAKRVAKQQKAIPPTLESTHEQLKVLEALASTFTHEPVKLEYIKGLIAQKQAEINEKLKGLESEIEALDPEIRKVLGI